MSIKLDFISDLVASLETSSVWESSAGMLRPKWKAAAAGTRTSLLSMGGDNACENIDLRPSVTSYYVYDQYYFRYSKNVEEYDGVSFSSSSNLLINISDTSALGSSSNDSMRVGGGPYYNTIFGDFASYPPGWAGGSRAYFYAASDTFDSNTFKFTEYFNGVAFNVYPPINKTRQNLMSSGTTSSAIVAGGRSIATFSFVPAQNITHNDTEKFDGTSWTNSSNFDSTGWHSGSAVGDSENDCLLLGGLTNATEYLDDDFFNTGSVTQNVFHTVQSYNGTSWKTENLNLSPSYGYNLNGSSNDATLTCGKYYYTDETSTVDYAVSNTTEYFDGVSWKSLSNAILSCYYGMSAGSSTDLIQFGQNYTSTQSLVETVNKNIGLDVSDLQQKINPENIDNNSISVVTKIGEQSTLQVDTISKLNILSLLDKSKRISSRSIGYYDEDDLVLTRIKNEQFEVFSIGSQLLNDHGWGVAVGSPDASLSISGKLNEELSRTFDGNTETETNGFLLSLTGNAQTDVEEYDGVSWSSSNNSLTAVYDMAGCGTSSSCLKFGGADNGNSLTLPVNSSDGFKNINEEWDGTSWSNTTNLLSARFANRGLGTSNDAVNILGFEYDTGYPLVNIGETLSNLEFYNGTSWSVGAGVGSGGGYTVCSGTSNNFMISEIVRLPDTLTEGFANYTTVQLSFDGTTLSAIDSNILFSRPYSAETGLSTNTISIGGGTGNLNQESYTLTQEFNGTSFIIGPSCLLARKGAVAVGRYDSTDVNLFQGSVRRGNASMEFLTRRDFASEFKTTKIDTL